MEKKIKILTKEQLRNLTIQRLGALKKSLKGRMYVKPEDWPDNWPGDRSEYFHEYWDYNNQIEEVLMEKQKSA